MSEQREAKFSVAGNHRESKQNEDNSSVVGLSRRTFLGASSAGLATAALASLAFNAQERANIARAEQDHSASNPGPENKPLLDENPNSNFPPPTDHGNIESIWYSFDLTHKRVQEGGWTNQVTQVQLPSSLDIAGVRMRIAADSFRELHWHTSDEWAFMLYGNARVTVLNPDGTIFIGDVGKGDLWYFPAGFPHSIQGVGPEGAEFMLIFDQGSFSEDNTFLLSDWLAHTPPSVLAKNFGLAAGVLKALPTTSLYIFPADLPASLAEDKATVGNVAWNPPTNTPSRWRPWLPRSKPGEVMSGSLTLESSWRQRISLAC